MNLDLKDGLESEYVDTVKVAKSVDAAISGSALEDVEVAYGRLEIGGTEYSVFVRDDPLGSGYLETSVKEEGGDIYSAETDKQPGVHVEDGRVFPTRGSNRAELPQDDEDLAAFGLFALTHDGHAEKQGSMQFSSLLEDI